MSSSLNAQSILAASQYKWGKAVELSEEILKDSPKDTDALNRMAYALLQMGYIRKAKKTYRTVLKIDKFNQIAQKNIKRLTATKAEKTQKKIISAPVYSSCSFLEESGKTKIVNLGKLASKSTLLRLKIGQKLFFKKKHRLLAVIDSNKTYLGSFPDDISRLLLDLGKKKCEYECIVKSVSLNSLQVFVREIKKPDRLKNLISFPVKTIGEKPVIHDYRDTSTGSETEEEGTENEQETKDNY